MTDKQRELIGSFIAALVIFAIGGIIGLFFGYRVGFASVFIIAMVLGVIQIWTLAGKK